MDKFRRKPSFGFAKLCLTMLLLIGSLTCNGEENTTHLQLNASNLIKTTLSNEFTTGNHVELVTEPVFVLNMDRNSSTPKSVVNAIDDHHQNIANISTIQTSSSTNVSPSIHKQETCDGLNLLPGQPIHSEYAQVLKCTVNDSIDVSFVWAVFYENCIEDLDNATALQHEIFNPCSSGTQTNFVYGDSSEDRLFVLQNGSLFRSNLNYTEYDVFEAYCLFTDENGQTMALVCQDGLVSVSKAQAYLYAICMLMSVPCLLVTAFFYLAIRQLRNLHGKSLACHCICLAIGFLLLSAVQIRGKVGKKTGFVIQYSLLACFLWLAVMCIDICTHVWYYLPRRIEITPRHRILRFALYAVIAQGVPLILVTLAIVNNLSGMPSYFLKGVTEATRWSQTFFIPPISTILFVCLVLLIVSYFGFRTLDPIVAKTFLTQKYIEKHNVQVNIEQIDVELYEETKQVAKSTAYLYIIMAMNWVFEIVSFYVSTSASLELFDILNALQGIVIFIIFISLPRPLYIIKHWWIDRGEFNTTEMEQLNRQTEIAVDDITNENSVKN